MSMPSSHDPAGGDAVFDRPSLLERLMDDEELVRELVEAFIADTPSQVSALQAAFAAGDLVQTERVAHRIKGSAANLSACRLQEVAQVLETTAHEGNGEKAAAIVPLIDAEFLRAKSAMQASFGL